MTDFLAAARAALPTILGIACLMGAAWFSVAVLWSEQRTRRTYFSPETDAARAELHARADEVQR